MGVDRTPYFHSECHVCHKTLCPGTLLHDPAFSPDEQSEIQVHPGPFWYHRCQQGPLWPWANGVGSARDLCEVHSKRLSGADRAVFKVIANDSDLGRDRQVYLDSSQ